MGHPGHTFQAWGLGLARTKQDPISRTHEKKSRAYSKIGHWSGKLTRRDQGMTSPMGYTEAGRGSCVLGIHVTLLGPCTDDLNEAGLARGQVCVSQE